MELNLGKNLYFLSRVSFWGGGGGGGKEGHPPPPPPLGIWRGKNIDSQTRKSMGVYTVVQYNYSYSNFSRFSVPTDSHIASGI